MEYICVRAFWFAFSLSFVSYLCFFNLEYLTQVDLTQERETQEINARQELDSGEGQGTAVPQWLQMVSRPGQTPLSFHGGLQILSEAVADCEFSS